METEPSSENTEGSGEDGAEDGVESSDELVDGVVEVCHSGGTAGATEPLLGAGMMT